MKGFWYSVLSEIGEITLNGGSITDGTSLVDIRAGTNPGSWGADVLDGVTLNGDLLLQSDHSQVNVSGGLTLNGTADLSGDAARLRFAGGTQTLTASPGQTATVQMGDAESFMAMFYGGQLTLDETVTVEGQGEIGYQGETIINEGTIHANGSGETLEISPGTFTNSGTLRVSGGTRNVPLLVKVPGLISNVSAPLAWTLVLEGDWDSQGAVELDEGGVLVLGGTFTTAGLNQASLTRGALTAVQLTGDLDNAGGVLSEIGEITLNGGSITDGTSLVDIRAGTNPGSWGADVLDGVTLNGDLLLQSDHSQVNVSGGLTLNGTADLSGDAARLRFAGGTQTLTASPGQTATVQMGDAESFMAMFYGGQLTLDETVTVEGQGEIGYQGETIINEGTIHANGSGETLEISPGTFTNSGTLRVSGGATLVLEGDWDSQGAVELDEGVLVLGGTFTTAGLNQASLTRGALTAVQLTGDLDNAGGVLSEIGEITLNGGSITDGTSLVDIRAGTNPGSWGADVLDGVTLNGDLLLQSDHSQVNVSGGLTLNGTADLSGDAARLRFAGGTQTLTASPGQTATVQMGDAESFMAMFYGGQLTLDETVTVEGQGEIGLQGDTVINEGTIHANGSGETLEISPGTFTNSGTLRVSGGATLVLEGDWDSQGAVELDEGVLVLGGTFTTAGLNQASMTRGALTAVQLTGDLDNAGGVLSEIGEITLNGGSITDGTSLVDIRAGTNPGSWGADVLDGVTLNGDLLLQSDHSQVNVSGGLTLNGTADLSGDAATLRFAGGAQTLTASPGQTATVQMGDAESFMAMFYGGQLTLDETVTVEGQGEIGYQGETIINQGTIHANVSGETLEISPGTFTNSGTLRVSGGATLVLEGYFQNYGGVELAAGGLLNATSLGASGLELLSGSSLLGEGTILGNLTNTDGALAPGSSPGTLVLNGDYTQGAAGDLSIGIGGLVQGSEYDFVDISGAATLAGTLLLQLEDGFLPSVTDTFVILEADGGVSGTFDSVVGLDGSSWSVSYLSTQVAMTFEGISVPEPGSVFLWVIGIFFLLTPRRAPCSW